MRVLGIETSCDETSAAVTEHGTNVLSCIIASSKNDFERLGGVIPEEAAREQLKSILPVIFETLRSGGVTVDTLDAIAVTYGPGLLGSLLVGTATARVLASVWRKPLIGVHHTLGHLSSAWLTDGSTDGESPIFPILTLSVSGGHTELWYRRSHLVGKLLGSTRDDAAGEAFDKGAVLLGLPYPGGPMLEKLALGGDANSFPFPRPLSKEDTLDFSFSGLKTSLKYLLRDMLKGSDISMLPGSQLSSVAAGYQEAICTHLSHAANSALARYPDTREIHIVGGVAANKRLREHIDLIAQRRGIRSRAPAMLRYCTDNGAMIAAAGTFLAAERPVSLSEPFKTAASIDLQSLLHDPSLRREEAECGKEGA